MSAFGFELKQAARRVFTWKQTGSVLIPAIGLALATIMFAVGWGYSSLSLPFKDADQLVAVGFGQIDDSVMPGSAISNVLTLSDDYRTFFDWKERKDIFVDIAAIRPFVRSFVGDALVVKAPNGNVKLEPLEATVNFFDVLGVSFPGIQTWKASSGLQNPLPMALLYKTGVNDFALPEIGREFQTHDGGRIVVSGVLPANFVSPIGLSYENSFIPFDPKPGDKSVAPYTASYGEIEIDIALNVIGRLAPGVTPQLAEQMLVSVTSIGREGFRGENYGRLTVWPLTDIIAKSSKPVVWGAWALGALTLLLCTANLAGLLLARCVYRLREYAMRSALGARFSDLLRMMLAELFLLSTLAALIAAAIAYGAIPAVAERIPINPAAFGKPVFGAEAVVFLIIATLVVAIGGGLFAAAALARSYYKGFSHGIFAVFHSHRLARIMLTAGQTAIATILLSLSWMTVRGYIDLFSSDPIVDTDARIVEVYVPPEMSFLEWYVFALDTLEALRGGDPDARVGFIMDTVLRKNAPGSYNIQLHDGKTLTVNATRISQGLLRALKVGILAGRDFTEHDRDDSIMINESLARRLGWSAREAAGRQITATSGARTVVGVVRDFPINALDDEISPMVFTPLYRRQTGSVVILRGTTLSLVIHPDAMARAGNIERTILRFNPKAVITKSAKWGDMRRDSVRGRTFTTFSVSIFSIAAIAIIVIGIVSTVTFIVARRTRDIAIQIALGAPSIRVCWFVMKDMVLAGVIGALIGGIASWWAGKAVAHYIYNGEKYQNLTGLAVATVVMLAIIAAASLLPALRALRVEPGRILNSE